LTKAKWQIYVADLTCFGLGLLRASIVGDVSVLKRGQRRDYPLASLKEA